MGKLKEGVRAQRAASAVNVGVDTLLDYLKDNGVKVKDANSKLDFASLEIIKKNWPDVEIVSKAEAKAKGETATPAGKKEVEEAKASEGKGEERTPDLQVDTQAAAPIPKVGIKQVGKIDLDAKPAKTKKASKPEAPVEEKKVEGSVEAEQPKATSRRAPAKKAKGEQPKEEKGTEIVEVEGEKSVQGESGSKAEEAKPKEKAEEKTVETQPEAELLLTDTEKAIKTGDKTLKVLGNIDLSDPSRNGRKGKKEVAKAKKEAKEEKPIKAETPGAKVVEAVSSSEIVEQAEEEKPDSKGPESDVFRPGVEKLSGPTVVGKIDLSTVEDRRRKPEASATPGGGIQKRRRRKRVDGTSGSPQASGGGNAQNSNDRRRKGAKPNTKKSIEHAEISKEEIEAKLKETRDRLTSKRSSTLAKGAKYRKDKRSLMAERREKEMTNLAQEQKTLKVSEFVSVSELAGIMDLQPNQVIETCMALDLMVGINQRLDAETMTLVAEEFGFKLDFVDIKPEGVLSEEDKPEDLEPRPPVFTVLGHVDHGKTTLCDNIRNTNVTAGEAGGITQHLGAYSFKHANGRVLTLIDTPGHEAYTAMRARGASITDVAVIIIAATEGIRPTTKEALSHASAMGAKIVFAINKCDLPNADPDKVKKELSELNYLVEDWGGTYQSQEISAKTGDGVDLLLDKVLLESDLLDLKANPNKRAEGVILESKVDKGLGHCAVVLVQGGTLRKGDSIVSGQFYGRVKRLLSDKGKVVKEAGPSTPVMVVGLNGAPAAGDALNVVSSDKEARNIASKYTTIRREVEMRARKHVTLDELGRRIAIGNFQQLNLIVKGDVDGSVEALSDSFMKLSTEEIQVNVVRRGVGQITEADVMDASAMNAIIIGFQVRPSVAARRLAESEQIDIQSFSVIYKAIDTIKSAMEGMLSPELQEEVTGTAEVMETFHISKVGTIAGCMVRDGKIFRGSRVHIIRDGIVIYTNDMETLKRFKDDVKEVGVGMDCGISIKSFNDIKVGDLIEAFREVEVKRTLD